MTPQQIALVQASFATLETRLESFTSAFYSQLFEAHPYIRLMFKGSPEQQAENLAAMLRTAVGGLQRAGELRPALRHLGIRHVGYGVRAEDYRAFGEALLWTVKRYLGDGYSPAVADAWLAFYEFVTGVMLGTSEWHVPGPADRHTRSSERSA